MEQLFNLISSVSYTGLEIFINSVIVGLLFVGLFLAGRKLLKQGLPNFRYAALWTILLAILFVPLVTVGYSNGLFTDTDASSVYSPAKKLEQSSPPKTSAVAYTKESKNNQRSAPRALDYAKPAGINKEVKTFTADDRSEVQAASLNLAKLIPLLLLLGYLSTVVILISKIIQSYSSIRKLKQSATLIDGFKPFKSAVNRLKLHRRIRFGISSDITIPIAAGFFNPMILLPANLIEELTEEELQIVLLHELAHLKRWDDFSKLAQKCIESMWFFNPVVKWVGRQIDLEREIAVDDIVIQKTGSPDRYATCLTRLMQLTTGTGTSLIPGIYSDKKQIFKRFEEILMKKKDKGSRLTPLKTASILTAAAVICVVILQITPVIALPGSHMTYQEMLDHLQEEISNTEKSNDLQPTSNVSPVSTIAWYEDSNNDDSESENKSNVYTVGSPSEVQFVGIRNRDGLIDRIVDWSEDVAHSFGTGTSITTDDDDVVTVRISERGYKLKAKFAGNIQFTDDERGIKSISDDGYIAIYEKDGSDEHEIDIVSDKNGQLDILYIEDDNEKPFDEDAEEWFADVLEKLYYRTGLNYQNRVDRIYAEEGTEGVVDELDEIESGYVKRLYLTALLKQPNLDDADYSRVLKSMEYHLDSDYAKAELLIDIHGSIQHNPDLIEDYVQAVSYIDSDYDKRRVMSELIMDKNSGKELIAMVLDISMDIDSDYDRAELLIDVADICADDEQLADKYIKALADIRSDYDKRRVFTALGGRSKLTSNTLAELIVLAEGLNSDYEKAELLIDLSEMIDDDPEVQLQLLQAVETLHSDYETNRVLSSNEFDCDDESDLVLAKLELLTNMSSDYEKVQALMEHADCASHNNDVRTHYLYTLGRVSSDYDKKRALLELIDESDLENDMAEEYITACKMFTSDYERGEVLKELADYVRGKEELEKLYMDVVDEISSDYDRDRLYKLIDKRRKSSRSSLHFD